jgi:carboxylesterase type B
MALKGITHSPYLPAQHNFDAATPTNLYNEFATAAGCGNSSAVLECLRHKDTDALQLANFQVSTRQAYGTWAFYPVTDFDLIPSPTTKALARRQVNGQTMFVGHNANEGPLFVPDGINTVEDLKAWLHEAFPTFSDADIEKVLAVNPAPDTPVDPNAPKYETNGLTGATAVTVSQVATGHQQRAANIYAEAIFICPSYWINDAYEGRSYHVQYSVPFASHGTDVPAYFGPETPNQPAEFVQAYRQMWGNYIKTGNPSIRSERAANPFPVWFEGSRLGESTMLNLNTTGGTPYIAATQYGNVTQFMEPGLENDFKRVNAYTWEGGRGKRCDFWKSMAPKIPY